MLTFKTTKQVFSIAFLGAIIAAYPLNIPWLYLLPIPILYVFLLGIGSAFIGLKFFMPSICYAETNKKSIALTFDDGVDAVKTPLLLDLLAHYNLKASFFVIGKKIKGNELLLKRIVEEGHIIANHSYTHSYFYDFYSTKKIIEDLRHTNTILKEITGLTPTLFRPPYGVTNPNIAKAVAQLQLTSIGWNVRSLDTVIKKTDNLLKRVTKRIQPGSILLFHDTGTNTLETVRAIILFAQENGYKIINLDQLLNVRIYEESY